MALLRWALHRAVVAEAAVVVLLVENEGVLRKVVVVVAVGVVEVLLGSVVAVLVVPAVPAVLVVAVASFDVVGQAHVAVEPPSSIAYKHESCYPQQEKNASNLPAVGAAVAVADSCQQAFGPYSSFVVLASD